MNLVLGKKTALMGILNATPDSFSDGGQHLAPARAVERAFQMIEEGVDIIDIGGESSRPKGPYGKGAQSVSTEEEINRTVPIINAISTQTNIPISIDTTKSAVAKQAIEAGAQIVNDISALRFDADMANVIAASNTGVVLMHMQGTPSTMQNNPTYDNVVGDISAFFTHQIDFAIQSGIDKSKIILDPGFGFGKKYQHNIELLAQFDRFHLLGYPLLSGPSRKQFTGPEHSPDGRLPGTLAAVIQSVLKGAHIVRVHDVWQCKQAVHLIEMVMATDL